MELFFKNQGPKGKMVGNIEVQDLFSNGKTHGLGARLGAPWTRWWGMVGACWSGGARARELAGGRCGWLGRERVA
jgi:hypothetical protein